MSDRAQIRIEGLSKRFPMGNDRLTVYSLLRGALRARREGVDMIDALSNIHLEAYKGEVIGLVGANGAGKTTLLKVLAGLYTPTSGVCETRGEVVLVSGLGVGMIPDLSVRENVYLYGAICRLTNARVSELFDEILEWAELEPFAETPFRNLSTGMRSRLAFSVTRHVRADVLLLDEALSAGDRRFTQKVEADFEARRRKDSVVIVASHSLEFVERFCTKAVWLRHGEQVAFGHAADVVEQYIDWTS